MEVDLLVLGLSSGQLLLLAAVDEEDTAENGTKDK